MMQPTTSWVCDFCGESIESAERGWVEWIRLPNVDGLPVPGCNIRIVHHKSDLPNRLGCQYSTSRDPVTHSGSISDDALANFLGPDGLTRLLGMIADQRLPTADLLEVIRRLHTPGYERARPYFDDAVGAGVIGEETATSGYLRQDELQSVLDFAEPCDEDSVDDEDDEDGY